MSSVRDEAAAIRITNSSLPYTATYRFPACIVRVDSAVKYALTELTRAYEHFLDGIHVPSEATFVIRRCEGKLRVSWKTDDCSLRRMLVERGRVLPHLERAINQYLVGTLGDRLVDTCRCCRPW